MFSNRAFRCCAGLLLAAVLIGCAVSCTQEKKQPPRNDQPLAPVGMPDLQPQGVMAPGSKDKSQAIAIPAGAQWTIYCQAMGGVMHVEQANALKAQLLAKSGMKDWYVIHQNSQSVLYYGFYKSIDQSDPKESARAHADQQRIQEMVNQSGERLFPSSFFVEVTTPDPPAPAEWNLTNASGYWSLQIAAYKDSPKRKQYAVDAVREARKEGIPAYFYHGDTISSVCIGAWPRSAVQEQQESSASTVDPNEPLLVLSQPLPAGSPTKFYDRKTGQQLQAMAPRLVPLDPSMIEAMKKYPNEVVNGVINITRVKDPATGQAKEIPDPSFLVVIPHKSQSILDNNAPASDDSQMTVSAPPGVLAPTAEPRPIGGKLRSLGD
jgi:hypothetical protein